MHIKRYKALQVRTFWIKHIICKEATQPASMMCTLFHVFGVTMLMLTTVKSFTCPPRQFHCPAKEIMEKDCSYGVTSYYCGQCWDCAKGYKEVCGGLFGSSGTCAEGLRCSNPYYGFFEGFSYDYPSPGICCRNAPLTGIPLVLPACKTGAVRNPCSGEYECKRAHGEVCGGDGDIKGVCADDLTCYYINATCIYQDKISSETED